MVYRGQRIIASPGKETPGLKKDNLPWVGMTSWIWGNVLATHPKSSRVPRVTNVSSGYQTFSTPAYIFVLKMGLQHTLSTKTCEAIYSGMYLWVSLLGVNET